MTNIRFFTLFLAGLLMISPAWATESFVVHDIKIEGLQNTEAETAFSHLPLKIGDTFNDESAQKIIKRLFSTGFFDDVRVVCRDKDVVIQVIERPTIAELTIEGARALNGAQIKQALKNNGIGESLVLNRGTLESAVQMLKQAYFSNGQYDVDIAIKTVSLEHNRIGITLHITEGESAVIREIRIIGAKAFDEKKLLKEFSLTTGGMFSWYSHDNRYAPEKLQGDMERLKLFYHNNGFMKMGVNSTQVLMSPDKKFIYIAVNISEGQSYKIGEIRFSGDTVLPEVALRQSLKFKTSDIFSQTKFTDSIDAITTQLGEAGYAFAKVTITPDTNTEKEHISFDVHIESGHQTYVRYINIVGNDRVKDEVIRREMRQMEQSIFDRRKIDRSRSRIAHLGYINSVNIVAKPVPNMPDTVDLEVSVTDRMAGELGLDFMYAKNEGLKPVIKLSSQNIRGSGKGLSLHIGGNDANYTVEFSHYVPYITPDAVSLGYTIDYQRSETGPRVEKSLLTELQMLLPISEYDHIRFGLGQEHYNCEGSGDACKSFQKKAENLVGSVAWGKDTRDRTVLPSSGSKSTLSVNVGLPGGDEQYYTLSYDQSFYVPLHEALTLALHAGIETGNPYGKTKSFPTFKNFTAGGIGSIRGFKENSLGQQMGDSGEKLGNNRKFVANAELWFPVFGMHKKDTVQLGVFFDTVSLWGPGNEPYQSTEFSKELRSSAGLGLIWKSPVGPIEFSYTLWRNDHKNDSPLEEFQFSLGYIGF